MLVELKPHDQAAVVPLVAGDIGKMLGVVVPTGDAAIVLTPQSVSTQQVLVAASGRYGLLVSSQGGPIKSGDPLTISALGGIAMKADAGQAEIIGRATGDFTGSNNVLGTITLKDKQGHSTAVTIGDIPASVQLAQNPLFQKNANSLPGLLSRLTNTATTQPAHTARLGLATVVLCATFFITGTIFYSSVRNGMVAIGRNPLAQTAIGRGLAYAIAAGLVTFGIGIFAVYLIASL
jgi:hypothetical protein